MSKVDLVKDVEYLSKFIREIYGVAVTDVCIKVNGCGKIELVINGIVIGRRGDADGE